MITIQINALSRSNSKFDLPEESEKCGGLYQPAAQQKNSMTSNCFPPVLAFPKIITVSVKEVG